MVGHRVVAGYWRWARLIALTACLVGCVGGCSSRTGAPGSDVDWGVEESELAKRPAPARINYYRLRRAEAPCDSPPCDGYVVQALQERNLRCPGGSVASECHVSELKLEGELPPGEAYVVRGRLEKKRGRGEGTVGVFLADAVWATDQPLALAEEQSFFAVADVARSCSKEPCPTARVQRLNTARWLPVVELDWQLDQTACPAQQLDAALEAMGRGELLVVGKLLRNKPFVAEQLVVSQVLLTSPAQACEVDADAGAGQPLCESDSDCGREAWCRETLIGPRRCVPYRQKGEECFWASDEPWKEERCQLGEQWCESSSSPSRPGICRTACKGSCPVGEWCSPSGCTPAGTCIGPINCWLSDTWEHEACAGYPTCERTGGTFGSCEWHCGNPACMDASSAQPYLGWCEDYVMGYAPLDGTCSRLLGCEAALPWAPPMFETLEECQATCETTTD